VDGGCFPRWLHPRSRARASDLFRHRPYRRHAGGHYLLATVYVVVVIGRRSRRSAAFPRTIAFSRIPASRAIRMDAGRGLAAPRGVRRDHDGSRMPPNFSGRQFALPTPRSFYEILARRLQHRRRVAQWLPIHLLSADPITAVSIAATFGAFPPLVWFDPVGEMAFLSGRKRDAGATNLPIGHRTGRGIVRHGADRKLTPSISAATCANRDSLAANSGGSALNHRDNHICFIKRKTMRRGSAGGLRRRAGFEGAFRRIARAMLAARAQLVRRGPSSGLRFAAATTHGL